MTGGPGSGKSAIAARLAQFSKGTAAPPTGCAELRPDFLSAVHFCSARDRRWINPHTFAESIALQLSRRYPAFAEALAAKSGDRKIVVEVDQRARTRIWCGCGMPRRARNWRFSKLTLVGRRV